MTIPGLTRPLSTMELDELAGTLRSALVSDVLDSMGLRDQCLEPGIVGADPDLTVIGYAYNVLGTVIDHMPAEPYTGLLDALDGVDTDEVWMISSPSDAALWGELTSTAVRANGARGTVCDGFMRDSRMVREMRFPVFSRGVSPRDCAGRVAIRRQIGPMEVGGVIVANGDLVVADDDGVVVVPARLILEVVAEALEKASAESEFRAAVREGMKPSVAYETFGVL